jgi:hypothetical protein
MICEVEWDNVIEERVLRRVGKRGREELRKERSRRTFIRASEDSEDCRGMLLIGHAH